MSAEPEFTLSRHARKRVAQRHVQLRDIGRALTYPDRLEQDSDDPSLTHAIKRFVRGGDSVVLRVVYNHTRRPRRVVTVYFDRKSRRRT